MFLLVILSFVEFHVGVSSNSIFIVAWIVEVMRKVCQVVSEGLGEILDISLKNCLETDVLCRDLLISNAPLQHYFELLEQLKIQLHPHLGSDGGYKGVDTLENI